MAWDKGGIINSPALSSGCTMNLWPDRHISCLEYPSHTNKHDFLSKNQEVKERCWEEKLQGLVAGLLSLSSFLIPFIDHVYLQWVSPALCISFLYYPIAPSLTYEILVFLHELGATGYSEPSKNNTCRALRDVCLPRGFNLASPSVLAASCEGGHLQLWWQNIDLHPQPFSPSTGSVKFLRAAENLPVKLLSM